MRNMMMNNSVPATAMPSAPSSVSSSMKLVIDTTGGVQRVVFAEAGKDVADFILGLVAMPLGAAHRLLVPEGGSLGSIGNVYTSAENMDAAHLQSAAARGALLVAGVVPVPAPASATPPTLSFGASGRPDWLPADGTAHGPSPAPPSGPLFSSMPPPTTTSINSLPPLYLYRCDACQASSLPQQGMMSRGFVKDMAKYTIMDDLTVTPTTNVSSVALLKRLRVKDLDAIEERTVNVGRQEAVDILKAALHSKTVLTDVFLKSNRAHHTNITSPFTSPFSVPDRTLFLATS